MDKEQAIQLKNKVHLLTFFIVTCEEEVLENESRSSVSHDWVPEEDEWHPDFEEAVSAILYINEHGYLEEDDMHSLNNMFRKWEDRFERLGLNDVSPQEWNNKREIEDDLYKLLKKYQNNG